MCFNSMTLSAAAQVVFCCVAKREDQTMPAGAKLLAWVEPQNGNVIAAFVWGSFAERRNMALLQRHSTPRRRHTHIMLRDRK